MSLISSIIRRIKPFITRRNIWVDRCHHLLLEHPERRLALTVDHVLSDLLLFKRPANLVQVGAYDGIFGDPIEPYVRRGLLCGLMVEPQPDAFAPLASRYHGRNMLEMANCAVSPAEGSITMYRVREDCRKLFPSHAAAMASTTPRHLVAVLNEFTADPWSVIDEITVEALTWEQLFHRYKVDQVDVLQIDTEGLDAELLMHFPFDRFLPSIVNFEYHLTGEPMLTTAIARLLRLGYKMAPCGNDMICYRRPGDNPLPT